MANNTVSHRLTTVAIIAIFGVMAAWAANPLRLKSGSLKPLKGCGQTICCKFDYSKTKGNRKPFAQYLVEDYGSDTETFERYQPEMWQWFADRWDDDIEKGPKSTHDESAPFTLNVIVKTMQLGSKSFSGGASISGYAEFYRTDEAEPFAVVEILKMNGTLMGGAMPGFPGLKMTFNDLAEHLCDLIYHN